MAYRLLENESTEEFLKRVASEQVAKAIEDLEGADDDLHEAVHEFRKRCKKIRGLIRLVRPGFPDYSTENAWFRDLAGELSALRDATSMQESVAALVKHYADDLDADAYGGIGEWLGRRRETLTEERDAREKVDVIRAELPEALARIEGWRLDSAGADALEAGLAKTYKRARRAMAVAADDGTSRDFHEWRKRVKYHRYHLRLLTPIWPKVTKARYKETKHLSDLLGDDHDLAVLRATLEEEAGGAADERAALIALSRRRSAELRAQAWSLGRRLFIEEPDRYAERMRALLEIRNDESLR
ncbi:CHAD domain-containing protein [Lentisalinibacter orientalis]|uniref:CHAD domain-containing protein n=1 Tax=Lentisalinibacter orientalis TaxID=2992241 RepID=UPI00386B918C